MYLERLKLRLFALCFCLATLLLVCSPPLRGQTFRGGVNGTVTDNSGAAIPQATVTLTDEGTAATHTLSTTSAGEFLFQDLQLGSYTVTITAPGFETTKVQKIPVTAGATYTLPVKLSLSSASTVVEVQAAGLALDTTSVTQTTDISSKEVNDVPSTAATSRS